MIGTENGRRIFHKDSKNGRFQELSTDRTELRFFAMDSRSGKFLRLTRESGLKGASLEELEHATYFPRFDVMLEVMAAVEKAFWNREFQSWHLVSTSAVFTNGKLVDMRSL